MAVFFSDALANNMLKGGTLDNQLAGGFIYFFAGPVPANADTALDLTVTTGLHTQLAKIAADAVPVDAGVTGLTFAATSGTRALAKNSAQTWASIINFVGKDQAQAGVGPLTATFFRFTNATDTGRVIGTTTTPRVQGSIATSGGDINLTSVSLSDNNINTVGLATFEVRMAL